MDSERRTIDKLRLVNFTAFKDLTMEFSPGINAIIGENATGKTHVLKALYGVCKIEKEGESFPTDGIFQPRGTYDELTHLPSENMGWHVRLDSGGMGTAFGQGNLPEGFDEFHKKPIEGWIEKSLFGAFIPAKDILSHAPGLRSQFKNVHLHFDQTYRDILDKAFNPPLVYLDPLSVALMKKIADILGGKVTAEAQDQVFIDYGTFRLDLAQVAEGHRKFALLYLLLKGGAIKPNSVLFWDEPEANLNPKLMIELANILLKLERMGVQIFFTTHDFIMLKYLDLLSTDEHKVRYHSLFRNDEGEIATEKADVLVGLEHNAIFDVFEDIFQKEMKRAAERIKID